MRTSFAFLLLLSLPFWGQESYEELFLNKRNAYHITTNITGDKIYAGTQKGHILEITNQEEFIEFQARKDLILAQAVSPENNKLITGTISGKLELWDLENPTLPIKTYNQPCESYKKLIETYTQPTETYAKPTGNL